MRRTSLRTLIHPRSFCHQVRGASHTVGNAPALFLDLGGTDRRRNLQHQFHGHIPIIDGKTISFPVISDSVPGASDNALSNYEVPNSAKIAARLFHNAEYQTWRSKWRLSVARAAVGRRKMNYSNKQMSTIFGTATNSVALVLRFARIASEISRSEDSLCRRTAVGSVLREILGNRHLNDNHVEAIAEAVHKAQKRKLRTQGTGAIPDIIMFLSFENVWQQLNAGQRQLVSSSSLWLQGGKMMSAGLAEGIKAFGKLWQNLGDEQRRLGEANLHSHFVEMSSSFDRHLQETASMSMSSQKNCDELN